MSAENHDVDNAKQPAEAAPSPSRARARLPGPGIGETLLWIVGFMAILIGIKVVVMIALMMWTGETNPSSIDQTVENKLGHDGAVIFHLLPNFLMLAIVLPACLWRLRPEPLRKLNFAAPSLTQLVILLATTVSLALFGNYVQALIHTQFVHFLEVNSPDLLDYVEAQMQFLLSLGKASLWILLFFLAVVPAVGEEFLFRGVVGRGLTARCGIVMGVFITSLLFACVHLYPPQVIALIPLAIFLHVSYLATRSFWAPLLVHFFNNALAGVVMHYGPAPEDPLAVVAMQTRDWILMALSGVFSLVGIIALWSAKTEYVTAKGEVAAPRYPTVERPPGPLALKRSAPLSIPLIVAFLGLLIAQSYVLWQEINATPPVEAVEAVRLESSVSHPVSLSLQASHVTLSS